jgi:glycosyltransferase involved in cell wall biosynthesis
MGVDVERYENASIKKFERVTGINPINHKLVLFCGYKNYEKGAITLLHSIENVVKKHPNVIFIMIGPPTMQYNRELQNLGNFKEHILNINPASLSGYFDKTKHGAFKACDVFVMPSRSDAYGIAYLEAWASKKPVIASNIPAMLDLFEDGKEGFHVQFDDPRDLALKINLLLDDKQLGIELGEQGYHKIFEEYLTWKDVAHKIFSIYQDAGFN